MIREQSTPAGGLLMSVKVIPLIGTSPSIPLIASSYRFLGGLIFTPLLSSPKPLMIAGVAPMSAGARAGIMAGDRIVAVGNTKVNRIEQLHEAATAAPPDRPVLIEVDRQGTPFLLALP